MIVSLYIVANLIQIAAGSCFTGGPWNTVRNLVGDVISVPNLAACQDSCLQNDQCAALSYSPASTCALLGADTGKAFKCPSTATLSIRDPACTAVTTSTTTSTTSTAATTTTLGIDKQCANTCLIQVARESSVDPVMIVDTDPLCMVSCPSGTMTARGEDGIWFDVPNNLLACYGVVHHNQPTDLKWCSPTTPYVGYRDPDYWITIVVQCSDCTPPPYIDPGCNSLIHECTQPVKNGDTLRCPATNGGMFVTGTNQALGFLQCIEGQWWQGDKLFPTDGAVYCKMCANVRIGDSSGYNTVSMDPTRSADGFTYTCDAPYVMWLGYHPNDYPDIYFLRRTTAFECVAPDYYWNSPGVDQGPYPTAMIQDWVGRGEAYDVGCSTNEFFGWGNCPLPKWVDPACDTKLHTCSEPTINGNDLSCPTGYGLIRTATNLAPACPWTCGADGQRMECGSPVPPATAVYCKTCADPEINWNSFTGDGVVPERSADGLSFICPAPYTEVWITYAPAGEFERLRCVPVDGTGTNGNSWFSRRTSQFVCSTPAYEWYSPGLDDGPLPNSMIADFEANGDPYDIGCITKEEVGPPFV